MTKAPLWKLPHIKCLLLDMTKLRLGGFRLKGNTGPVGGLGCLGPPGYFLSK